MIQLPAMGNAQTLEWWHYQSHVARDKEWSKLVSDIGLSELIVTAPAEPPMLDGDGYNGSGLGYTAEEAASTSGGTPALYSPSNRYKPGW